MVTDTQELLERLITYCYRLLARRPYSEQEVRTKLEQYGYKRELPTTPEVIESVLTMLRENKYIDDVAFANWFSQQRQTHRPRSKRILEQELRGKFLDEKTIVIALANYNEKDAVALIVRKKPHMSQEELRNYLYKRGFSSESIEEALNLRTFRLV